MIIHLDNTLRWPEI